MPPPMPCAAAGAAVLVPAGACPPVPVALAVALPLPTNVPAGDLAHAGHLLRLPMLIQPLALDGAPVMPDIMDAPVPGVPWTNCTRLSGAVPAGGPAAASPLLLFIAAPTG